MFHFVRPAAVNRISALETKTSGDALSEMAALPGGATVAIKICGEDEKAEAGRNNVEVN